MTSDMKILRRFYESS